MPPGLGEEARNQAAFWKYPHLFELSYQFLFQCEKPSAHYANVLFSSYSVPRRNIFLLISIAYHRRYGRAVWIDPVVLRAITISWNDIVIPVRPYHGRDDKPLPWWFTNDFGRPRLRYASKRPQTTQHQGRSESQRCGHYPHASASLPQRQINELRRPVQVRRRGLKIVKSTRFTLSRPNSCSRDASCFTAFHRHVLRCTWPASPAARLRKLARPDGHASGRRSNTR